jgi:hypothetical protein
VPIVPTVFASMIDATREHREYGSTVQVLDRYLIKHALIGSRSYSRNECRVSSRDAMVDKIEFVTYMNIKRLY